MAQNNRDKNIWFIPKRANVHQMLALLDAIIKRNYDGTTWNPQKQDNLNLDLKNLGATKTGKKIAPQGMRTLLASIHYLGFVYLDTTTVPTTLRVTKVGYDFYDAHKSDIKVLDNLNDNDAINESDFICKQMDKLQITNPIILPHCEDIYLFPFRVTLIILLELDYLAMEEIAMYVFHTKKIEEIPYTIEKIKNFRTLDFNKRENLVRLYESTDIGNITLKKAPSAGYFMQLCVATKIITRERNVVKLSDGTELTQSSIRIKGDTTHVSNLVNQTMMIRPYDFKNDLNLWIEYFGNPERRFTPINLFIKNISIDEVFFEIYELLGKQLVDSNILTLGQDYSLPVFPGDEYIVQVFDVVSNKKIYSLSFKAKENIDIQIKNNSISYGSQSLKLDKNELAHSVKIPIYKEIIEHSAAKNFSSNMQVKLNILKKHIGIDKTEDKNLRGAYYEYLFYQFLQELREKQFITDVFWNGNIGKYNLPVPAPGGKTGTPDIVFIHNNVHYILELTTIKSKSQQTIAELASVPDHIKLYKSKLNSYVEVRGIFCAPIIHDRVHTTMKTILDQHNILFSSITDDDLLSILMKNTKHDFDESLKDIFNINLEHVEHLNSK